MVQYLIKIDADGRAAISQTAAVGDAIEKLDRRAASAGAGIGRMVSAFAGLFGVRAVLGEITATIGQFGRVADEAKRAGVSVEKFQEWSYALRQSGIEPSALFSARKTLATAQTEALAKPDSEAAMAFQRIGVTRDQLGTMNSEQLIDLMSTLVPKLGTEGAAGSANLAAFRSLMGRESDALMGVFRDGFGSDVKRARESGLILPERDVALLDRYDDQIAALRLRGRVEEARVISRVGSGRALEAAAAGAGRFGPSPDDIRRLEETVRRGNEKVVETLEKKL